MAVVPSANGGPCIGYLNGRWGAVEDLQISIDDLGFLQAVTAVERLRSYEGQLFQRAAHLDRLRQTSDYLRIDLSNLCLELLLDELLDRNTAWIASQTEFGVTLFVTPGRRSGQAPTVGLHCNPLDRSAISRRCSEGQAIVVTDVQQPPTQSWPRYLKVRCRLHYYLADQEAGHVCPGALGVLLDQDGTLTETSVANLAVVQDGRIVSPPPDRILPGITQRFLEAYAHRHQIPWVHQPLPPERLGDAEEILLFGTTTGVWNGWLANGSQHRSKQAQSMSARLRRAFPGDA